jgi:hypothetical protein
VPLAPWGLLGLWPWTGSFTFGLFGLATLPTSLFL